MTFDEKKADEYNEDAFDGQVPVIKPAHLTEMTLLFQRHYGLLDDGMCGPVTRSKAIEQRAARHPAVAVHPAVSRARSMVGKLNYVLGAGGRDPKAATPETTRDGRKGCDCVGFVMWCLGIDRFQSTFALYGGWMNTDSTVADAEGPVSWWELRELHDARPGDLVVFPSVDLDHDGDRDRIGHVGIVTVAHSLGSQRFADLTVAHCHGGPGRPMAVNEESGSLWDGRFVYKSTTNLAWRSRVVRLRADRVSK